MTNMLNHRPHPLIWGLNPDLSLFFFSRPVPLTINTSLQMLLLWFALGCIDLLGPSSFLLFFSSCRKLSYLYKFQVIWIHFSNLKYKWNKNWLIFCFGQHKIGLFWLTVVESRKSKNVTGIISASDKCSVLLQLTMESGGDSDVYEIDK